MYATCMANAMARDKSKIAKVSACVDEDVARSQDRTNEFKLMPLKGPVVKFERQAAVGMQDHLDSGRHLNS
jgi:hypothetical protein